jgi:hypothetical protein
MKYVKLEYHKKRYGETGEGWGVVSIDEETTVTYTRIHDRYSDELRERYVAYTMEIGDDTYDTPVEEALAITTIVDELPEGAESQVSSLSCVEGHERGSVWLQEAIDKYNGTYVEKLDLYHDYQYGGEEPVGDGTDLHKFTFTKEQLIALMWNDIYNFHGQAKEGAIKSVPEDLLPDEIVFTVTVKGHDV